MTVEKGIKNHTVVVVDVRIKVVQDQGRKWLISDLIPKKRIFVRVRHFLFATPK